MNQALLENVTVFSDLPNQVQRILIVDDESRIRSSLRILLDGAGREIPVQVWEQEAEGLGEDLFQ